MARPLLWVALAWSLCCLSVQAQAPQEGQRVESQQKKVFLLYTERRDGAYSATFERVIRQTLTEGTAGRIDYYGEYIDDARFSDQKYRAALADFIRRKYEARGYDLVVAVGGPALSFVASYGTELFPETPVVFYGSGGRPGPNYTGVAANPDLRSTVEVALRLQPHTKNIFVISGASAHDRGYVAGARQQLQPLEARVTFYHLEGLPMDELLDKVANLPRDSIIYYLVMTVDRAGTRYSNPDALSKVSAAANAPVYIVSDWNLNYGALGGSVVDAEALARQTADIALRVLRGEKAENIPLAAPAPNFNLFSWRELRRWGIGEESLPAGSVVRFKELSLWQEYKGRIIGALVLIALQAALIAVLLVERRRRQRAKEALDRLNAELEGRVAERTSALTAKTCELESFAFTVAHDLKAPLRAIDGYGRLLHDDYMDVLDEKGRTLLHTIRSSSVRMSRLIEDLLAYSRVEQSAFVLGRVELWPLVAALVAEKRDEIEARGIELTLSVNGASVTGDADGLKQALGNYLDNAIKFTRDAAHPSIKVGADETEGGCCLWVRDNGVGFDMKHRERVFEIFHRLRPAGDYPGTGVGLAIARKAAERMGGRAWAESEPGRGSTFYLEVPKEGRAPWTASPSLPNTSLY